MFTIGLHAHPVPEKRKVKPNVRTVEKKRVICAMGRGREEGQSLEIQVGVFSSEVEMTYPYFTQNYGSDFHILFQTSSLSKSCFLYIHC